MNRRVFAMGLVLVSLVGGAPSQTTAQMAKPRPGSTHGVPVEVVRTPADARIPAPADLDETTMPREFVESFLVALAAHDPGLVYDTYLDVTFRRQVPRESFVKRMGQLTDVVGDLQKLAVMYLRQDNGAGPTPDHGRAKYILIFDHDPKVEVKVEFLRANDGAWRITDYSLDSPALARLYAEPSRADDDDAARAPQPEVPPAPRRR
ncbi:MAG: hypothetical protein ACE5IK_05670 [Acidobacteriota bacterium]